MSESSSFRIDNSRAVTRYTVRSVPRLRGVDGFKGEGGFR